MIRFFQKKKNRKRCFVSYSKRAQASEFIAIALLVVVLTIILLFSKLGTGRKRLAMTEKSMMDYENLFISTSVTKFPYVTYKGISINEMLGAFICYEEEEIDYGPGIGIINLIEFPRSQLDEIYGKNKWRLEIDKRYCIDSSDFKDNPCAFFSGEYITYEFYFPLSCRVDFGMGKIYIST